MTTEQIAEVLGTHEPTMGVFAGSAGVMGCACMDAREWRAHLTAVGAYDPPLGARPRVVDIHRAHVAEALATHVEAAEERARIVELMAAARELPGFDEIRTHGDAANWLRDRAACIARTP